MMKNKFSKLKHAVSSNMRSAFLLFVFLLSSFCLSAQKLEHGSLYDTGLAISNNNGVTGATVDYKVVTVGFKTWGWVKINNGTIKNSDDEWAVQIRWNAEEGHLWNKVSDGEKYGLCYRNGEGTVTVLPASVPDNIRIWAHLDNSDEWNNQTDWVPYDYTSKNTLDCYDTADPTAPNAVLAANTGMSLTLTFSATDENPFFYYIEDVANGVSEVSFFNTITFPINSGVTYNLQIRAIDFTGNESAVQNLIVEPVVMPTIFGKTLQRIPPYESEYYYFSGNITQGTDANITGIANISGWWLDPDWITADGKFAPITGNYRILANYNKKYFQFEVNKSDGSGDLAELQPDGSGAVWLIGGNVAKPNLASTPNWWNPENTPCLAPIADKLYRFTVKPGETNSIFAQIQFDYINFRFAHKAHDWGAYLNQPDNNGGVFTTINGNAAGLVYFNSGDGNQIFLQDGKIFAPEFVAEKYEFIVDLTGGINNAVLTVNAVPATVANGKMRIAAIGDSNTQNGSIDRTSWVDALKNLLPESDYAYNFGVSGATLSNTPDAYTNNNAHAYENYKLFDADKILVALGTNDSKIDFWAGQSATFGTQYSHFLEDVKSYAKPAAEVYVITPIKAISDNWNISNSNIENGVIPAINALSLAKGINVIDWHTLTAAWTNTELPDGIHAEVAARTVLTEKVRDMLMAEKPVVSQKTESETAIDAGFADYRWYKDGVLVAQGADKFAYTAAGNGTYKAAVKLTANADDVLVSEPVIVSGAPVELVIKTGGTSGLTGINSVKMTVSPNPVSDRITILGDVPANAVFTLYNLNGQKLLETREKIIPVSMLSSGIYILKTGTQQFKIIKK